MDYYGLLFLYYLKGLSGKSILRLFFNIEAGGTEQLLPENTSVPTTTPILADIQYPDGLRTDQYFTYRETPTTVSNKARIKTIKGNTLAWNQLVQNGNFADSSLWSGQFTTVSISNGIANVTLSAKGDYVALRRSNLESVTGHKYFVTATVKCAKKTAVGFYLSGQYAYSSGYDVQADTLTKVSTFINGGTGAGFNIYISRKNELEIGDVVEVSNVMLMDLTKMGLDSITDPSEFTSLFPLSYYSYNQGSLLSFNGNGIKTVGKNLYVGSPSFDDFVNRDRYTLADETYNGHEVIYKSEEWYGVYKDILLKANVTYTFSSMVKCSAPTRIFIYNKNTDILEWKTIGTEWTRISATFTPSQDIVERLRVESNNTNTVYLSEYQLEIGLSATDYEPYTSSTLSLPISTYFPTGMKSAGNVYDELTESKATTRIGSLKGSDIQGTVSSAVSTGGFHYVEVTGLGSKANGQGISNMLPIKNDDAWSSTVPCIQIRPTEGIIRIYGAFTTFQEFQTQYASLVIYYELATPTETPITTEDANEALSLLMGKSVSSDNAKQMIDIITKGE